MRGILTSKRGIVNMSVLIGLLIMAVAIPVTARLVKQRQEIRRGATGTYRCTTTTYFGDHTCTQETYVISRNQIEVQTDISRGCFRTNDTTSVKIVCEEAPSTMVAATATPVPTSGSGRTTTEGLCCGQDMALDSQGQCSHYVPGCSVSTVTPTDTSCRHEGDGCGGNSYCCAMEGLHCGYNGYQMACIRSDGGLTPTGGSSGGATAVPTSGGSAVATAVPTRGQAQPEDAKFNGVVVSEGTNRWMNGNVDCANRRGVSITTTSGTVMWGSSNEGGNFNVIGNPWGQQQTVRLTLPSSCGYVCDTWEVVDRGDNLQGNNIVQRGTGCVAIFTPQNTDWRSGVTFWIKRGGVAATSTPVTTAIMTARPTRAAGRSECTIAKNGNIFSATFVNASKGRMWITRQDGGMIGSSSLGLGSTRTYNNAAPNYLYLGECVGTQCNSVMNRTVTGLTNGNYYAHCSVEEGTSGSGKCSGNPWCNFQKTLRPSLPGGLGCDGWIECSLVGADNLAFTVSGSVTPSNTPTATNTPTGTLSPTPTGNFRNCSYCDATGDGKICQADINAVGECYAGLRTAGCSNFDMNNDGRLNVLDLTRCGYCMSLQAGCPTATPSPTGTANAAELGFRMAYSGVGVGASCVDWPLEVTVMGGGETAVYDVDPVRDTSVTNRAVFAGLLDVSDMTARTGLAVFIRGPKHLQIKYGVDNQSAFYNRAGGEVSARDDYYYNFSAYPLLAGDVVGESDQQDGVIDGRDFSYVKNQVILRVERGGNLKADLDGDCILTSIDVAVLMQSLVEKQSQLY